MAPAETMNKGETTGGTHGISAVYCKLFSDSVTAKICTIRKNELNGRGGFTCKGCTMEKY